MDHRKEGHSGSEEAPGPEWDPDIRRVALVLDVDLSVVAMSPQAWALYRLDTLARSLQHELGVMAIPVRIEIDGWPRLA
jgi:hypothetical protein